MVKRGNGLPCGQEPRLEDNILLSLSDRGGVLCVQSFDIQEAPQYEQTADALRDYLIGRPLAAVDDVDLVRLMAKADDRCKIAVLSLLREWRRIFVRRHGKAS